MKFRGVLVNGLTALLVTCSALLGQGELRFCLRSEPRTLNPLLTADESSEAVRYLTAGVLIRMNRLTQVLEPELVKFWKVSEAGRTVQFELREGLRFSDGTPFSAEDVAFTMRALMDPQLRSPVGDSFRSAQGVPEVTVTGPRSLSVRFPSAVAGVERLFDQVAMLSSRSPLKEKAVLGPFLIGEHKPGVHIRLDRNPHYWKHDEQGRRLPYLDSIYLEIQQNREIEFTKFQRGQVHLINALDAEQFQRLSRESPGITHDSGPSLDSEMIWFNQAPSAPIPQFRKDWFRSRNFRRAVSAAIRREDLCRMVYLGFAQPAAAPFSAANRLWHNPALRPHEFETKAALRLLALDGFRLENGVLKDSAGNRVEFSLVTNAGNKAREKIAAMVQADLAQIGIRLNVVALDFPSLIERISRSFSYDACLLGLTNVDLDPNGQMNVWLSSAANHQWNPGQKTPATSWETEIDRLMYAQSSELNQKKRKASFDQVQRIIWEEAPMIYLVHKNALSAVARTVINARTTALRPQTYWNAERLRVSVAAQGGAR
ncbi:MAG: ABC transporter substrate-binding protein [Bryobacterales bacterium]|nr:ABC transporter substrate-binding protein [Bryobacterales bacterium]